MDELRAKLVEIVSLYEEKRLKTYEGYQDQYRYDERRTFASIMTGLNIAIGWLDEFKEAQPVFVPTCGGMNCYIPDCDCRPYCG